MEKERNFMEMLRAQWARKKLACVGLDSMLDRIPDCVRLRDVEMTISRFNRGIVDATCDIVCAYKLNIVCYESEGTRGLAALRQTVIDIHILAPDVPIVLDAKRGDIGHMNAGYVRAAFDYLQVDAITVHPFLGRESLDPFLARTGKGVFVLCRTSNPGAGEFQDMPVVTDWASDGQMPLYQYVAFKVAKDWNERENCGLVVGATYPGQLRMVRGIVGDMPILIPGIGVQQPEIPLSDQVRRVVEAGKDRNGQGLIVSESRGIIFASNGPDFADAARRETLKLDNLIHQNL